LATSNRKTPKRPARLTEAAPYARTSVMTIRRRIKDGTLRSWRVGPKLLVVDLDEIDARLIRPIASARDSR
jgi:excisionase family DNA binding protein